MEGPRLEAFPYWAPRREGNGPWLIRPLLPPQFGSHHSARHQLRPSLFDSDASPQALSLVSLMGSWGTRKRACARDVYDQTLLMVCVHYPCFIGTDKSLLDLCWCCFGVLTLLGFAGGEWRPDMGLSRNEPQTR
ncbi:hypothetical protein GGTG_03950 [Gaeumannomyces tritici R3-111a-1]|uniref:Uncharacterized protein n=1 Tax=Gaeumannomyces tritici (strain R3-111a-1) TaxID=644352 RepID=J3NRQ0_GAET3|nr:hypothetical protein GGTG_03950 [Gaeumannomyces tritici R3-111a-1]EJT78856.1 hypothetical protein GGTG_03950 [Gaeumannomyces tritici R3-111a-1]